MMSNKLIKQKLNGIILLYVFRDDVVSFGLIPSGKENCLDEHRLFKDNDDQVFFLEPMIQLSSSYDNRSRAFCYGYTDFNSESSKKLKYLKQERIENDLFTEIDTYFISDKYEVVNVVKQTKGYKALTTFNKVKSLSNSNIIERFDAFNIQMLSPFLKKHDPSKLISHYFESFWSMEARKVSEPLSKHHLEDSWLKYGYKVNRIGSLGMMPARGYHPFMAIEDIENNVTWAVQYQAGDSWMIELVEHFGSLNLLGGHADYNYGHWKKELKKNEVYITNEAIITVVNGGLIEASNDLVDYQNFLIKKPDSEKDLPIIYSEYLYSWGSPYIKDIKLQMEYAKKVNAKCFVIDAGWHVPESCPGDGLLGDWNIIKERFPNGIKEFADVAKENNIPIKGIWYEFEAVTTNSELYKTHPDYLAKIDGHIITLDNRCLIDFNNKEAVDYLYKKVTKYLKDNNLNYIKNDYNENLGFEIDGPSENKAENVRTYFLRLKEFILNMQKEIPDLVYETCACGGMRHDVAYTSLGSMMSFSDSHEIVGGAAIAMDLHYLFNPSQLQVWASILPTHNIDEVYYTTAKAMLGRMCFSGKLNEIKPEALDVAIKGSEFYQKIKHIIKDGTTTYIDTSEFSSIRDPKGTIKLIRDSKDHKEKIVYIFSIIDAPLELRISSNVYKLESYFSNGISNNNSLKFTNKYNAFVGYYKKQTKN